MSRALSLLALVLLLGCPSEEPANDDDATIDEYTLEIVNESSTTFTLLEQRPCPSTDEDDYRELALPTGGLAMDEAWRWLLPTPGCFHLRLQGDGCFAEGETGPLQLSETFTWTVTDADPVCQGG